MFTNAEYVQEGLQMEQASIIYNIGEYKFSRVHCPCFHWMNTNMVVTTLYHINVVAF